MKMVINIIKVNLEKDGLFIMEKLKLLKYQMNGILGCIIQIIKLKIHMNLKKYKWQKEHLPNQTGTENAYHPKNNKNAVKKKYKILEN